MDPAGDVAQLRDGAAQVVLGGAEFVVELGARAGDVPAGEPQIGASAGPSSVACGGSATARPSASSQSPPLPR
jgi:hypothetical protein